MIGVAILTSGAVAVGAPGSTAHAGAVPSSSDLVPFTGTHMISATWGSPSGGYHTYPAIDIQMDVGTPVLAAGSGRVTATSYDRSHCNPLQHSTNIAVGVGWCDAHGYGDSGTVIEIRHGDGSSSIYHHLSEISPAVYPGAYVTGGQQIALSGETGITTGPHLHYMELSASGARVDPGLWVACQNGREVDYSRLQLDRYQEITNDNADCARPPVIPPVVPAEGSVVRYAGSNYRIAGGAPLYLGSVTSADADHQPVMITEADWEQLNVYPADGTILDSAPGGVYSVTGGVATIATQTSSTAAGIDIDPAVVANAGKASPWNHLNSEAISGAAYVALVPARLMETRPGLSTIDGWANNIGVRPADTVTALVVAGRGGVNTNAAAVTLNVTVDEPGKAGYVTVYPCGAARPTASNVNFVPGQTIAAVAITKVGTGGKVCIYTSSYTQLVVDVTGFDPAGADYVAMTPGRLLETRPALSTIDGLFNSTGAAAAGAVTALAVGGRDGIPTDAAAAVVTVTVTQPAAAGYVTVFPCGTARPNASNVNFAAAQTVANTVVAKLGAAGTICVFTSVATHLVVDVTGYHPAGAKHVPLDPARLADTRVGTTTIDGISAATGARAAGSVSEVLVAGRGGVAVDAVAVVVNVTVTGAAEAGYVTLYPCGEPLPNASNVNFNAAATVANVAVTKIGTGGRLCVYSSAVVDVIIDVAGYQPA